METFKVACSWKAFGTMHVEAETLDEAIAIAHHAKTPLPDDHYYIDDSFDTDSNASILLNE